MIRGWGEERPDYSSFKREYWTEICRNYFLKKFIELRARRWWILGNFVLFCLRGEKPEHIIH